MNKDEYLESVNDMIYLIYCIINDKKPDKSKIENMNLENIYNAADAHMLTAITAMALESVGVKNHAFTQAKGKALRKVAALDIERAELFNYCDNEGIWYMPLKGAILKDYYPSYGMRQMSDNDILFDSEFQVQIKEYFEAHGYEVKEFDESNQDVYIKPPVVNFEMHTELFDKISVSKKIYGYYKNIKEHLIKDGEGFRYRFTDEDFYIYMMIHEYKHYTRGGTGLRSILDTYVFLKKFSDTLDRKYIDTVFDELGISDFEKSVNEIAFELFEKNQLRTKNKEMFEYIVFSGTYGNFYNFVSDRVKALDDNVKLGKIKYIMKRLYVSPEKLKDTYPLFYKYKILIPLLPFYRVKRLLTTSRKRIKAELKALNQYK